MQSNNKAKVVSSVNYQIEPPIVVAPFALVTNWVNVLKRQSTLVGVGSGKSRVKKSRPAATAIATPATVSIKPREMARDDPGGTAVIG